MLCALDCGDELREFVEFGLGGGPCVGVLPFVDEALDVG